MTALCISEAHQGTCPGGGLPAAWTSASMLCQIRKGFRASWHHLVFSVESDSGKWTLRVFDLSSNQLYAGDRSSAAAAKLAAAEFALFHMNPSANVQTPEKLARDLSWQEYW